MRASFAKSQFVEVERLTAFGPRFRDKSVKLGARTLVIDDFFPTLVTFGKLAQLLEHSRRSTSLSFGSSLMISDALTEKL
jgi:hypothetical protein